MSITVELDLPQAVADKAKAYHASISVEVMALRPDDMRKFQQAEYERFRRIAEAAGVKPQ